jgi:hypothetical protein
MDWPEIKPEVPRLDIADYPPNTIKPQEYLYYIKKCLFYLIENN